MMALFDTYLMPWIGVVGILLSVLFLVKDRRKKRLPPGPIGVPLIGYMPFLGKNPLKTYHRLSKIYGPIVSVNIAGQDWVILSDYDLIHEALVKRANAFSGRPKLHVFEKLTSGYGIILRDYDDDFKTQKKFAYQTLRRFGLGQRSMEDRITEEIKYFTELIESKNGKSFNCQTAFETSVSNVICSVVMGSRFSYDDEVFLRMISKQSNTYFEGRDAILFGILACAPFLRWVPPFHSVYQRILDDANYFKDILTGIIDEHKKTFNSENIRDFIDTYLIEIQDKKEEKESFNENQLCQIVRDLFLGGTDTTASTLRWCILYFANYPDVQQKLWEEVEKVIGHETPFLKQKEIMPYTCSFIREITRYKTLLPMGVPHVTTKDTTLRGYDILKGTPVIPLLYAVHHDEKCFENPYVFNPERFMDENGNFKQSKHVIPFSIGPRHCIAEQLAKMELFLFLTSIVQRFEIVPDLNKELPSFHDDVSGFVNPPPKFEVSFRKRE